MTAARFLFTGALLATLAVGSLVAAQPAPAPPVPPVPPITISL